MLGFRQQVEALIDGDDVKIVHVGPTHGGWDDEVVLACGQTRGSVLRLYNRRWDVEEQMSELLPWLRKREAKRLDEAEILNSTMARFYV